MFHIFNTFLLIMLGGKNIKKNMVQYISSLGVLNSVRVHVCMYVHTREDVYVCGVCVHTCAACVRVWCTCVSVVCALCVRMNVPGSACVFGNILDSLRPF